MFLPYHHSLHSSDPLSGVQHGCLSRRTLLPLLTEWGRACGCPTASTQTPAPDWLCGDQGKASSWTAHDHHMNIWLSHDITWSLVLWLSHDHMTITRPLVFLPSVWGWSDATHEEATAKKKRGPQFTLHVTKNSILNVFICLLNFVFPNCSNYTLHPLTWD